MTILAPCGGPWAPFWDHFAIKWVTDALRGTLEGPRVDFYYDGKRSRAVDVGLPWGEAFYEGGFGGKQVGILGHWDLFLHIF